MPNSWNEDLSFTAPHTDGSPRPDARSSEASVEQLAESVEQIRIHLLRAKRRIDRMEQQADSLNRYVQALWLIVFILILGSGGLAWYGLSALRSQRPIVVEAVNPTLPESKPLEVVPASLPVPAPAPDLPDKPDKPDTIARQRIDFQVDTNQTVQISSGIYLTVKSTDVGQRVVDGWLQTAKDGRIVWIRSQEAEKQLSFESKSDSHPSYLYFTRVETRRVAGYLMLPLPKGEVAVRRQTGSG